MKSIAQAALIELICLIGELNLPEIIIITVLSYIGWPVLNNNDVGMKLRLD